MSGGTASSAAGYRRWRTNRPSDAPNALWSADFKGQFKLGTGAYCYPLTVVDSYSRYLLACRGLESGATPSTRTVFEGILRTYGLPDRIRTDNGAPFATSALERLSALSVWWIKLGITPQLIQPAHPEHHASPRPHARALRAPEYPRHYETRYVSTNWRHPLAPPLGEGSHVLAEEYVGSRKWPTARGRSPSAPSCWGGWMSQIIACTGSTTGTGSPR